jgi:hypothetical protein
MPSRLTDKHTRGNPILIFSRIFLINGRLTITPALELYRKNAKTALASLQPIDLSVNALTVSAIGGEKRPGEILVSSIHNVMSLYLHRQAFSCILFKS